MNSPQKPVHPGRPSLGKDLEGDLCSWIDDKRSLDLDVTPEQVAFEVLKMQPEFFNEAFLKVRRWVYRFLVRNDYSMRDKTHIAQRSMDVEGCMDCVVSFNERNRMYRIGDACIINMDETPLYNDQKPNKTIATAYDNLQRDPW